VPDRTKVNVEWVRAVKAELRRINAVDLKDIEFVHCGKPVAVDPQAIEEWRFTGLNNTDFIEFLDMETGKLTEPERAT
jgi:hypothetical protein